MMTPVLHLVPGGTGRKAGGLAVAPAIPFPPPPPQPRAPSHGGIPVPLGHPSATYLHVHFLPITWVVIIHGAFNDLRGQVIGGPTDLCSNSYIQDRSAWGTWKGKIQKKKKMETKAKWCLGWDSSNTGQLQSQGQGLGAGSQDHLLGAVASWSCLAILAWNSGREPGSALGGGLSEETPSPEMVGFLFWGKVLGRNPDNLCSWEHRWESLSP